jgi:hypothetical protein
MLINKDTIKTDYTDPALPDDTGDKALPDATGSHNTDMPLSFGDNNPHKSSPQTENSLKLLLDCDSIIRASSKIDRAAPHIYERCNKADGVSITNALKTIYKHKEHPNDVFIYKRSDIKYDIQRGWVYLVSLVFLQWGHRNRPRHHRCRYRK